MGSLGGARARARVRAGGMEITPLGRRGHVETLKRNMVPGRGEIVSLEHLIWVGLSDCLLVGRIVEHLEGLVGETSPANLESRMLGAQRRHAEHLLYCC